MPRARSRKRIRRPGQRPRWGISHQPIKREPGLPFLSLLPRRAEALLAQQEIHQLDIFIDGFDVLSLDQVVIVHYY